MLFNIKSKLQQIFETMAREGDPEDDHLNEVEVKLILPRACSARVENIVCKAETDALEDCRKRYGFFLSPMCGVCIFNRCVCLLRNRGNDDIKDDCCEEYIALRSHYRRTKDPEALRRMKAMIQPKTYGH